MSTPTPTPSTLEPGQVVALGRLVDIAPQAIVSRTVMRSGGGSVTLFAFDQDQELAEHTAPFDAMVAVLDGAMEIRIGGRPHRLAAGETVIMPASIPHALRAERPTVMMLVMLRSNTSGA